MAGATLERELTGKSTARVRFDIADRTDDADIRRLLRETPMAGRVSISLEREPNYFADAGIAGETKQTIVARDKGRLVCMGSCAIRRRFVNGEPRRVGYLGGLRLDSRYAGRFDILRRGYEFCRELQAGTPADFYFTSIAADNERARKFLERGITGMPTYDFVGEFVTMLISTQVRDSGRKAGRENRSMLTSDELISFLNSSNKRRQFAPCWSVSELHALEPLGMRVSDFFEARENGQVVACGALWDQRHFKQTVIRSYAPWLKFTRPIVNGVSRVIKGSQLPPVGETLASAFASNLAFASEGSVEFLDLVKVLQRAARQREIEFLTLGFAANDPHLAMVKSIFSVRKYQSRLYVVRWPGIGGAAAELDERVIAPEVALL
jgi:hypothetical protein